MTRDQLNETLLYSFVTIDTLLFESIRFLDNCSFREECCVKEQIVNLDKELGYI
jgi:hypothetical protein